MAPKKPTTREQALRKMRKFQDEFAGRIHGIVNVEAYQAGDYSALSLHVAIWPDGEDRMQTRDVKWASTLTEDHPESPLTFDRRFEAFRKEFVSTFFEGGTINITY